MSSHFQHRKDCKSLHYSVAYQNDDVTISHVSIPVDETSASSPLKSIETYLDDAELDVICNNENDTNIIHNDDLGNDFVLKIDDAIIDEMETEEDTPDMIEPVCMYTNQNDNPAFSFHNDDCVENNLLKLIGTS